MLRIHKRGDPPGLLCFRDNMQRNGRFAGGLRAVDLHDASSGDTAHAKRIIQRQAAGGDDGNISGHSIAAELHHGALAELLVQIGKRMLQRS